MIEKQIDKLKESSRAEADSADGDSHGNRSRSSSGVDQPERSAPNPQRLGEQQAQTSSDTRATLIYDAQKKSVLLSYILWWFLGFIGVHRFYLGRIGSGVTLLIITFTIMFIGVLTLGIGWFLLIIPGVWWLIDAFLIPGIVASHNQNILNQVLR